MQVWDAECAARVEKHRRMRAEKQLRRWSAPCIWTPCVCPAGHRPAGRPGQPDRQRALRPRRGGQPPLGHSAGLDSRAAQCENLIVVSNEVFSGGADYAGDTDRYLLALAQVNNALAARADAVVRVVCGIPVYYKGVEK